MIIGGTDVVYTVLHLIIVASLGYFLRKRRILLEQTDTFLTTLLVNVTFPCLTFSTILAQFDFSMTGTLGVLFLASLALFVIGIAVAVIPFPAFRRITYKKELVGLIAFQNCAYIPMNIALFIKNQAFRDKFLLYVFLYTAGFNLIMWSLGSFFIFRKKGERFETMSLLTPPVSSVFISLAAVWLGISRFIPSIVLTSLKTIGDVSFFLSLLLLGSALAAVDVSTIKKRSVLFILLAFSLLKLMAVPGIVHLTATMIPIQGLLGYFILIEAAMPSAVSLVVVGSYRRANLHILSAGIFLTTLMSAVTIPFWLSYYHRYM